MSRGFFDNNKDIDSEAEFARHWSPAERHNFITRMERKLEYKELIADGAGDVSRV